jgi:murein DD-endopeptidase MepM/ murein hydrolase activator NlpD
MIKISINLPLKKRLHIHVANRRQDSTIKPLFPKMEEIRRVKKGSHISRYFRHIFEHNKIKRLFGTNIAFAIIATTLLPNPSGNINIQAPEVVNAESPIVLPTQSEAQYPVAEIKITQGFKFYHPALDLDGVTGDPIKPVLGGNVEAIDQSRFAYGNAIYINHGNGLTSLYAHLSKILVKEGQEVTQSTIIGLMGSTGRSTGDHLHLEIRRNGVPVNPLVVLPR